MALTQIKNDALADNYTVNGKGILTANGLAKGEEITVDIYADSVGYVANDEDNDAKWDPLYIPDPLKPLKGHRVVLSNELRSIRLVETNQYRFTSPAR